ncbi:AraC family transcriptional regulator [Bacteroides sp. OttesenSCG-928-N06]|nr:AraC family transcriptional regulator [Bacteroides sp. OttesenSCG-928-N06]
MQPNLSYMEEEIRNFDLEEFIRVINPQENYADQVIVMEMRGDRTSDPPRDVFPLRFGAASSMLVCKGELSVTMDYIPYTLTQHMLLERSNVHLISNIQASHDFRGYHIIFGKKILNHLFEEVVAIPREYALNKRYEPVTKLDVADFQVLVDIAERLRHNIRRKEHFFQKGLVLNEVRNFLMESSGFVMKQIQLSGANIELNHFQDLALRFMQLLIENCHRWHEVSDYSTELCVTPVYLSRTIKSLSGQTAMECINKARIAEAKILLRKPENTVQHVADVLHFSDQSAFGKFFKKHTGKSPMEFKKEVS